MTIFFFGGGRLLDFCSVPHFPFFSLNADCLIERLQAFIQGNKQLARLALKTLVGCQHGSFGEILLEEYLSQ